MAIMRKLVFVVAFAAGFVSSATALEYGDIVMDATKESMAKADVNAVVFPHWFHRIRFKCKVCHEDIFVMRKGANDNTMQRIMEGKSCGACHNGQIAWEPLACERCHNAKPTKGAAQPAAAGKGK